MPDSRPQLTTVQIDAFRARGVVKHFRVGERLISIGAKSREVFYLLDGSVKIVAVAADGTESVFGLRSPGNFIGEMSTLTDERRSADVVAVVPTQAIMVTAARFNTFLEDYPSVALSLLRMQTQRLNEMTNRAMLGSLSVKARIAQRLLELAAESPTDQVVNLTQTDLALYVDASREWTSKALGELRRAGAIRTARGQVVVLDQELLGRTAQAG